MVEALSAGTKVSLSAFADESRDDRFVIVRDGCFGEGCSIEFPPPDGPGCEACQADGYVWTISANAARRLIAAMQQELGD